MNICGNEIRVSGRLIRVARLDGEKYRFLHDPEAVIAALRSSGVRIDLFTFLEGPSVHQPQYSYPILWDNLAVLPVTTYTAWWTEQIDAKTRNMVRKSQRKGLEIHEVPFDDNLVRGIWTIYNECPVRQGKPFAHFGKDIATVRRDESTYLDTSIFIGAFLDGALIGFVKLLLDEDRSQAGLLNIVSMVRHRDKATMNGLVAKAVDVCAERHIPYLVYSNFSYGKKLRDSLSDFKSNNGFRPVDVPRYYVPLSWAGSLALHLNVYDRFDRHLPDSLMSAFRRARSAWYRRKLDLADRAS